MSIAIEANRELAIARVLEFAVESWINQDMDTAIHMVCLAEEYREMPHDIWVDRYEKDG